MLIVQDRRSGRRRLAERHWGTNRRLENVRRDAKEVAILISVVLLLFVVGTIGYSIIEGWSVFESFYMTVITLSTVGYGEVHNLNPAGRAFTAGLIIAGVGVAAYSFTFITRAVVEGEIYRYRGYLRMQRRIEALKGHSILCGWGRLGRIVGEDLAHAKEDFVVVESDPSKTDMLQDQGVLHISGSAYDDEVLRSAGIEKATHLLALLPNDADNVYTILCAREMNPNLTIVTRSEDEGGEKRLRRAGANQVIAPYRLSGSRIVQQLIRPNVSDFLEITSAQGETQLALEEVRVPEGSQLDGKTLEDSRLRQETGAIIAAIISPQGEMIYNPGRESIINSGSTMIVLGDQESLDKLSQVMNKSS